MSKYKKEIDRWWKFAMDDLDSAEYTYDGKKYRVSAFLSQQAVEKAFKAVLLKRTGEIRRIHDLVTLGRSVDVPKSILSDLKELTMAYTYSRYPDTIESTNINQKASGFLKIAKEALKWAEQNL